MKKIFAGTKDTVSFKNRSITGLRFHFYLISNAVNVEVNSTDILTEKINVRIRRLLRKDRKVDVYTGNLKTLIKALSFGHYRLTNLLNTAHHNSYELVTQTAGLKHEVLVPVELDLHGGMILKDKDKLEIEIDMPVASLTNNIDTTVNTSYLEIDVIDGITEEIGVPVIKTHVVETNQDSHPSDFGDVVNRLFFINNDKTSAKQTDQVINSVSVFSDKYDSSMDYNTLFVSRRVFDYALDDLMYQSFDLTPPGIGAAWLNDVRVEVDLNSANVTANNNFVVALAFDMDPEVFEKGRERLAKHELENQFVTN